MARIDDMDTKKLINKHNSLVVLTAQNAVLLGQ